MSFVSADGLTTVYETLWEVENEPIGMIQLVHGIGENMERYENIAHYFNEKGYIVYGIDVIGHGKSLQNGIHPVYFGQVGSWKYVVEDVYNIYLQMHSTYSNLPCFMIGFSMGSFILRTLMIDYDLNIQACFLLGTGTQPVTMLKGIHYVVKKHGEKIGDVNTSDFIDNLAFQTYNRKFKNTTSNVDWLLQNTTEKQKFINDDDCYKYVSAGLFRELLSGMIYTCDNNKRLKAHYPIYLLSGKEDAVGDFGKGIIRTVKLLKKQGAKKVEYTMSLS
ncbi:MAG: alpha/beta hydrolase [Erysipelotrichaceae bacterium]|nr:alpha/beta hydrolase [Erysipelotrichaceae bacterium]